MLYDSHLDVFMKVAEAGSFSAAASDLYISPSAVIKQINLLETDLETRLFERTHRGLRLTKGGRILYEEAKELIRLSNRISDRVKGAAQEHGNVIRIGVSPLTPLDRIEELLREVRKNAPDIHYYMVPFENTQENAREILKNLGKRIDVVAGIFDEGLLAYRECRGLEIQREKFCIAVAFDHPLAGLDKLTWEDLYGYDLMLLQEGSMKVMDQLRDDICRNHPVTAALHVPDAIRNIVTTVVTGGVSMIIIFAIDKTIFAPGFGGGKKEEISS